MSFGCAGCGRCCDPVVLAEAPAELAAIAAYLTGGGRVTADVRANTVWVLDHFEALESTGDGRHAYACDAFDPASGLCSAYDERPPMCRAWPSGRPGLAEATFPPGCSYRWDLPAGQRGELVGRLLPLTPV